MAVQKGRLPDSVPWVVKTTTRTLKTSTTLKSFSEADSVARKHTLKTGEFAQAVRS